MNRGRTGEGDIRGGVLVLTEASQKPRVTTIDLDHGADGIVHAIRTLQRVTTRMITQMTTRIVIILTGHVPCHTQGQDHDLGDDLGDEGGVIHTVVTVVIVGQAHTQEGVGHGEDHTLRHIQGQAGLGQVHTLVHPQGQGHVDPITGPIQKTQGRRQSLIS